MAGYMPGNGPLDDREMAARTAIGIKTGYDKVLAHGLHVAGIFLVMGLGRLDHRRRIDGSA